MFYRVPNMSVHILLNLFNELGNFFPASLTRLYRSTSVLFYLSYDFKIRFCVKTSRVCHKYATS